MMYRNNKKGGIGQLLIMIVTLILFFALYPFWQTVMTEASNLHTGLLGNAISFIPFIVIVIVLIKTINLDPSGGGE